MTVKPAQTDPGPDDSEQNDANQTGEKNHPMRMEIDPGQERCSRCQAQAAERIVDNPPQPALRIWEVVVFEPRPKA